MALLRGSRASAGAWGKYPHPFESSQAAKEDSNQQLSLCNEAFGVPRNTIQIKKLSLAALEMGEG